MAFITDFTLINNAATTGDWTASGFDSPTLNDSAATTPIYIEGTACMWWPLKKGTTNGYVYEATANISIINRLLVAALNYPFADIDNIPITALALECSSGAFESTNYAEVNALTQILSPYNTPISGHTPIMLYPDAAIETGTPDYSSMDEFGWVATTGNDADGKQGGFDFFFAIGWIGEHSETFTNTFFDDLYEESYDSDGGGLPGTTSRPLFVISRSGDFFQSNVRIHLGDGTADTANLIVTETGKTIFFSNLHVNHELGYVFTDPASTHEVRLTLTDCVHFWTDQAATNDIFETPNNATYLKVDGCSFTNGGRATMPSYSVNRWFKTTKFSNCGVIDIGDGTFEDNTVSGATLGVLYVGSTDTRRAKRTAYNNNTSAIEFDTVGNYTLDGDQFSGNTNDIVNSDNAATITAGSFVVGRAYKILTVGTTDFTLIGSANNTIGTKFVATGVGVGTGTATEVLLINATNGANPSDAKISNTGTNADTLIQNAVTLEITVEDKAKSPIQNAQTSIFLLASPYTELMNEDTTAGGIASESFNYGGSEVDIFWRVRKSEVSDNPRYFGQSGTGTITADGFSLTVTLEENTILQFEEGFSTEANAVINNFPQEPTESQKTAIAAFVDNQVTAGNWAKIEMLYIGKGLSAGNRLRHWKINRDIIKGDGSTSSLFPTDVATGWEGDGVDDYMNLNWNPTDDDVGGNLASDRIGFMCKTESITLDTAEFFHAMGLNDTVRTKFQWNEASANDLTTQIGGSDLANPTTGAVPVGLFHHELVRVTYPAGTLNNLAYYNGVLGETDPESGTPTLPAKDIGGFCSLLSTGLPEASTYYDGVISMFGAYDPVGFNHSAFDGALDTLLAAL